MSNSVLSKKVLGINISVTNYQEKVLWLYAVLLSLGIFQKS